MSTTQIFGTIGFFMAGPPGAYAGIALGSYVDQQYLFPMLFETESGDPAAFDDLTITTAKEGANYPYCLGTQCRVPGIITWMSEPRNEQTSSAALPVMGKGGGGSRPNVPTVKNWYCDVRIAFNYSHEDTIVSLEKVLGNGRILYELSHIESQTGLIGCWYLAAEGAWAYYHSYPGYQGINFSAYKVTDPPGGGGTVGQITVSGYPEPSHAFNNGDFDMLAWWNEAGKQRMSRSGALGVNVADTYTITIEQTTNGFFSQYLSAIKTYLGAMDQDADEANDILDETWGGTGATGQWPCYRGVANISLMDLHLTQFSNQMPRFDFIVKAHATGYTYGSALQKICVDAGVPVGSLDVTNIPYIYPQGASVRQKYLEGAVFYGPRKARSWLQALMIAGNILYQRDGSTLKFFSREMIDEVTIDADDVGVFEIDGEPVSDAVVTNLEHMGWQGGVIVEFYNIHDNIQKATVEYYADDQYFAFDTQKTLKYQFPISMSRAEATAIAKRQLWLARAGKQYCKIQVPYKYCHILENDAVIFTKFGRTWRFVVQKRERAMNGLLVLEGPNSPETLDHWEWEDNEQTSSESMGGSGLGPGVLTGEVMDFAPFKDEHVNKPGLYLAACGSYPGANYDGCQVWESDDDVDYTQMTTLIDAAGICVCDTTLGGGVDEAYWDDVNTLQISTMQKDMFLESCTKLECQNGLNRIAVKTSSGWEVLGFADVSVDATSDRGSKQYTISTFLRGLCNTEHLIDSHGASETAVVLTAPGIYHVPQNTQRKGRTKYFKFVPMGRDESDYSGVAHDINLGTVTPFQPCHIAGSLDGSNDLTVTWDRRTRSLSRMFAAAKPVDDFVESYEIDFYDGATIVRTVRNADLTGTLEHEYTAAQQTTDGLTPGDPVKLRMYQMSPIIGRGKHTEVTI